jgi:nitroreductase
VPAASAPELTTADVIAAAEPFLAVIAGRRSVRAFTADIPPRELVIRAIEAATYAPSGMNKQPWRFVIVANEQVKAEMVRCVSAEIETILAMLAGDEYADKVGDYLRNYATLFRGAPFVINVLYRQYGQVIASLLERSNLHYADNQEEAANPAMQSVSAAIENLQLAAHALGLATCWMTAPLFAKKQLHELLRVEAPWELAAVVPIGYAATPNTNGPRRLRLDRVVEWVD